MDSQASQLPTGSQDKVAPDDVFSQGMGEERNGRVRMLGLGVTPTEEFSSFKSKSVSHRLFIEQQEFLEQMNEKFNKQEERYQQQEERYAQLLTLLEGRSSPPTNNSRPPSSSSNHLPPRRDNSHRPLVVNASVLIKSVADQKKVVAKGYIVSMVPSKEFGRHRLGANWCEVNVQHVINEDEPLMRPISFMEVLTDAVGTSIAWPCSLVSREEED